MSRYCPTDAALLKSTPCKADRYRHDPYAARGVVYYFDEADDTATAAPQLDSPPEGTRHLSLWGAVSFVPYPADEFRAHVADFSDGEPVRVFIGQLPYFVTDMQLAWLCYTFGGGRVVAAPERIMKRQPCGERLPTGCIHAYASTAAVDEMAHGMHKRMLVDDTGVWYAQTADEFEALTSYVRAMKEDRRLRVPNRPYDTVVVQVATSTYVPDAPLPLTLPPPERKHKAVSPGPARIHTVSPGRR